MKFTAKTAGVLIVASGLDVLLKFYGGEQVEEIQPAQKKVSLVKLLKVALIMNISGSMSSTYNNGTFRKL